MAEKQPMPTGRKKIKLNRSHLNFSSQPSVKAEPIGGPKPAEPGLRRISLVKKPSSPSKQKQVEARQVLRTASRFKKLNQTLENETVPKQDNRDQIVIKTQAITPTKNAKTTIVDNEVPTQDDCDKIVIKTEPVTPTKNAETTVDDDDIDPGTNEKLVPDDGENRTDINYNLQINSNKSPTVSKNGPLKSPPTCTVLLKNCRVLLTRIEMNVIPVQSRNETETSFKSSSDAFDNVTDTLVSKMDKNHATQLDTLPVIKTNEHPRVKSEPLDTTTEHENPKSIFLSCQPSRSPKSSAIRNRLNAKNATSPVSDPSRYKTAAASSPSILHASSAKDHLLQSLPCSTYSSDDVPTNISEASAAVTTTSDLTETTISPKVETFITADAVSFDRMDGNISDLSSEEREVVHNSKSRILLKPDELLKEMRRPVVLLHKLDLRTWLSAFKLPEPTPDDGEDAANSSQENVSEHPSSNKSSATGGSYTRRRKRTVRYERTKRLTMRKRNKDRRKNIKKVLEKYVEDRRKSQQNSGAKSTNLMSDTLRDPEETGRDDMACDESNNGQSDRESDLAEGLLEPCSARKSHELEASPCSASAEAAAMDVSCSEESDPLESVEERVLGKLNKVGLTLDQVRNCLEENMTFKEIQKQQPGCFLAVERMKSTLNIVLLQREQ